MSQTTIDHSGRHVPKPKPHDDGWDYDPRPRITQLGDEVFAMWGYRWIAVVFPGFHLPDNVRCRRPKKGATNG